MARFSHRETGAIVSATRLKSVKQVETQDRGWVQAGVGNWEVVDPTPGIRPLVLEDHEFREAYAAEDQDAEVALDAPGPATLQQTPKDAPAPPDHAAHQNLPEPKTARDYAAEHAVQTPVEDENVDPITGEPSVDDGDAPAPEADPVADIEVDEDAEVDAITGEPVEPEADAGDGDAVEQLPEPPKKSSKKSTKKSSKRSSKKNKK